MPYYCHRWLDEQDWVEEGVIACLELESPDTGTQCCWSLGQPALSAQYHCCQTNGKQEAIWSGTVCCWSSKQGLTPHRHMGRRHSWKLGWIGPQELENQLYNIPCYVCVNAQQPYCILVNNSYLPHLATEVETTELQCVETWYRSLYKHALAFPIQTCPSVRYTNLP